MNKQKLQSNIKQFISYFFVGGIAALVEWATFFIFESIIGLGYLLATVISFAFATTVNWILGRHFTFKTEAKNNKKFIDALVVFLVSGVGLGFNMVLMYLFVGLLGLWPLFGKILSTGIVFLWNFAARKYIIYKK